MFIITEILRLLVSGHVPCFTARIEHVTKVYLGSKRAYPMLQYGEFAIDPRGNFRDDSVAWTC